MSSMLHPSSTTGPSTAIDYQRRAGDKAGGVAGQIEYGARDLPWSSRRPKGRVAASRRKSLGGRPSCSASLSNIAVSVSPGHTQLTRIF